MTADSVPAPMVQLPADKLEALRTTHTRWEVSDSDDAQATLNLVAAVRAVVDAATPAASVPAADILALVEKWEGHSRQYPTIGRQAAALELREVVNAVVCHHGIPYQDFCGVCVKVSLPAHLDEGEAFCDEVCCRDRSVKVAEELPCSEPCCAQSGSVLSPPLTPHEPPCGCGHPKSFHSQREGCRYNCACTKYEAPTLAAAEQADKGGGGQRGGKSQDTATPHDPPLTAPAAPPGPCYRAENAPGVESQVHCPVPVNDEAEAWPVWYHANIERLWDLEGRERDEALFKAGFRAARGEDA